jgi:hypothetical protein
VYIEKDKIHFSFFNIYGVDSIAADAFKSGKELAEYNPGDFCCNGSSSTIMQLYCCMPPKVDCKFDLNILSPAYIQEYPMLIIQLW